MKRRDFLKGAGALIVSFKLQAQGRAQARDVSLDQVDSWIAVAEDESITIYSGKCDFGQGFSTVQVQLAAEELNVPVDRITLIICDTALTPDQGTTDGSQSDPTEFGPNGLRQALATAREALFQVASSQLNTSPDQLTAENGVNWVSP